MKNNHRAYVLRREDFDGYWKLHRLWRNPKVKIRVMKCDVCHPTGKTSNRTRQFRDRKFYDPREVYRNERLEMIEDQKDWEDLLQMEEIFREDLHWDSPLDWREDLHWDSSLDWSEYDLTYFDN